MTAPRGKVMFSYCRHPKKKKGAKERVLFLSVSTTDDDDDDDTDDDYYAARSCPSSYDQSSGNGQSLSRRYCTQSVWLFSCATRTARTRPKALWRFRVSTSNSPSGRSRLHTHTHTRQIDHTYAQQDIRVCEDDHYKPPMRQFLNPKAL